jgi:hypothetical protein
VTRKLSLRKVRANSSNMRLDVPTADADAPLLLALWSWQYDPIVRQHVIFNEAKIKKG